MIINTSNANWQKELLQAQMEIVKQSAEETLNDIVLETFKKHMQEDFYDDFEPKRYDRSHQMRDKIGVSLTPINYGNTVEFGINFDEKQLDRFYLTRRNNISMRYTIGGEDVREDIMESILNGTFDSIFNSSLYADRHKSIIEEVKKDIEMLDTIKAELKIKFAENGFIVK